MGLLELLIAEKIFETTVGAWFWRRKKDLDRERSLTYWKPSPVRLPVLDNLLKKLSSQAAPGSKKQAAYVVKAVRGVANTAAFEEAAVLAVHAVKNRDKSTTKVRIV